MIGSILKNKSTQQIKLFLNKKKRRYYAIFPNNSERDVILKLDALVSSDIGVRYPRKLQSGDQVLLSPFGAIYTVEM